MDFTVRMIAGFMGTLASAVLLRAPLRLLLWVGAVGAISRGVGDILNMQGYGRPTAVFFAAGVVAVLARQLARLHRVPVTIFSVPGVIPLLPGSLAYFAMLDLFNGKLEEGATKSVETAMIGGAIALGIVVAGSLARALTRESYHGSRRGR